MIPSEATSTLSAMTQRAPLSTRARLAALAFTALAAVVLCLGCEAAADSATAPRVTNLQIEDRVIRVGVPVDMAGGIDVEDVDGDIAILHLAMQRPDGSAFAALDVPITGAAGRTSARLPYGFEFTADAVGRYTLEVWVEDADGQSSNHLTTVTSEVTAVVASAPEVDELAFTKGRVHVGEPLTFTGTLAVRDADGDLAAIVVQLARPDGSTFAELTLPASGATATVPFSYTTTPDVAGMHVLHAWAIDAAGNTSEHETERVDIGDVRSCAALEMDCSGQGVCYDITDSTCAYFEDHRLTPPEECATIDVTGTTGRCVSSVSDPQSPLLTDENRCDFVQYWALPTDLPIDCRCSEAAFDQRCRRPYEAPQALKYGDGPTIRGLAPTYQPWRGLVEGREWFLPVMWSTFDRPDETMIFAIDLDSGDRRYFSGAYDDNSNGYTEVGSGDRFVQIMDLKKGADGMFYAVGATSDIAPPKLWRIDPTSGARTKIFDEETALESELCPNYSTQPGRKVVQMTTGGWTMGPDGSFYFSNIGAPGTSVLRLRVAGVGGASATSCSYLTRVTDCPTCSTQDNVGAGFSSFQFDLSAFEIVDGSLYAVSDKRFIEIDLATGNRKQLSFGNDTGALGTGPINAEALADRWTTWDAERQVFWTVGILGGSAAVTVDPTTGNRTAWPCWHPGLGILSRCGGPGMALVPGPLGFGGMVIDPKPPHDLYFAHDLSAVVKYEVKTGNSYVLSL